MGVSKGEREEGRWPYGLLPVVVPLVEGGATAMGVAPDRGRHSREMLIGGRRGERKTKIESERRDYQRGRER